MTIAKDAVYAIWLTQIMGYGNQKSKQLINTYGSARGVFDLKTAQIEQISYLTQQQKAALRNKNLDYANGVIHDCEHLNVSVYCYGEEGYPDCLSVIYAPPTVLYEKGHHYDYDTAPTFAIVGTRSLTEYGRRTSYDFAKDLSKSGMIIVSGMADGCDSQAHLGALKSGQPTVAVLGTGVDVVYPAKNRELYDYICSYGAVLSEYPPGTKATRYSFPERNRIISAISMGTLVVEGNLDSGSLITADHANNQGKDVFVIPNNIYAENSRGTNQLLKEFALVAVCPNDIVERYIEHFPEYLYQEAKEHKVSHEQYLKALKELSDEEKILLEQITEKPRYVDDLVRRSGLPVGKVNGLLTLLMMKDIIYCVPGNAYALKL